ncbi:MAG: transposase [Firmicutes bacterium]|nr:transposase [Bacillota bacterium]
MYIVYLFANAVYESLRQQAGLKEGILVTWGILGDGSKVLIHLSLGNKESCEDWLDHLRDLVRRGLPTPLTVTTDGAPGLIKAVEAIWPEAERIRLRVHKMRNVLDKVPEEVLVRFADANPSAMLSFEEDLGATLARLELPAVHHKHVRTTNLIERNFDEE